MAPHDRLARSLAALGAPSRLCLLRMLRKPMTLSEIRVGNDATRVLSRQCVKEHLDKLVEVGLVVARPARRSYGAATEYAADEAALRRLVDDIVEYAQ